MRRIFLLTIAALTLIGFSFPAGGQSQPRKVPITESERPAGKVPITDAEGPPAKFAPPEDLPGSAPPPPGPGGLAPKSASALSKETLLVWAYLLRGYVIPKRLSKEARKLKTQRPISLKGLRWEYKKHLGDKRFQGGWKGIFPGISKRVDIVKLLGLPDFTQTSDFSVKWLYRDRKGTKTLVFEFFFAQEGLFEAVLSIAGDEKDKEEEEEEGQNRDPQLAISVRVIPKKDTFASEIRKRFGEPESVQFSDDAILLWKYLRGILVEFKKDRKTVDRIIFRINDVLRVA